MNFFTKSICFLWEIIILLFVEKLTTEKYKSFEFLAPNKHFC